METPDSAAAPQTDENQKKILDLLSVFQGRAEKGELQGISIAYLNKNGVADVLGTPMSVVSLNHLGRLFELRVVDAYKSAMAKESATRSPTGAMRSNSPRAQIPPVDHQLPRKARRLLQKAQKKMLDKSKRAAPLPIPKATQRPR